MHGHINSIKFVESSKFDKVYSKNWNIFVWWNCSRIWRVLIHQITSMKNKSNFKSSQRRKNEENKTTNESTRNILVARSSFGAFGFLIFVIYFVIWSFVSSNNSLAGNTNFFRQLLSAEANFQGCHYGSFTLYYSISYYYIAL